MTFHQVPLQLSEQKKNELKISFKKVIDFLEQGGMLNLKILDDLQKSLSNTIAANKQMAELLQHATDGGDFFHVNLTYPDPEILNLPWGIATDPISQRPLNEHPQLFISKNSLSQPPAIKPATPGPLKILVMIASPKDLSTKGRLNFEDEERQIIQAFEPLFKSGAVQIDFTDDGSLDALRRKVKQNDYHILHFSGHGSFDEKKQEGLLLLENPLNLKSKPATAREFAEAILKDKHTIRLVMLSACQTAQAKFEQGIAGVTGTLLQKGIPAVVAMGMSISDKYASSFAAHFYQGIAEKKSLAESFSAARQHIKSDEAKEIQQHNLKTIPLQWIIPNLYLADDIQPVDWSQPFAPLHAEDTRVLFANTTMEKSGVVTDIFVGRREDYARIMPLLAEKKPVMLKGQGGIGKTTMAKKLIQRLKAFQPGLIPFIYNEEGKDFSLDAVLEQLKDFCLLHDKSDWVALLEHYKDNLVKQIIFLLTRIADEFPILLLFDNLETFQNLKTEQFSIDHQGTLQIIAHAIQNEKCHTILTGRYPVKEFDGMVPAYDLNDIDQNDFIRKCYNLGLEKLSQQHLTFLFAALGGNFRMLEFFHRGVVKHPKAMEKMIADLEAFKVESKKHTDQALRDMAENLIFDQLWDRTAEDERRLAQMLCYFDLPVLEQAFQVQGERDDLVPRLARLQELTLVQAYLDRETDLLYFYMPPLVKNLLRQQERVAAMPPDFHEHAGIYHFYMHQSLQRGSIAELAAAFWQFVPAKNQERIESLGEDLSGFYYRNALYFNALEICQAVEGLFAKNMPFWCSNRMGLCADSIGKYDQALLYYQSAFQALQQIKQPTKEDRKNIGTTLNNISQIFQARGDYEAALRYLQQSLQIFQEIGDKSGEGTTLNNISQIYDARGDYDTALRYLQQSLHIFQEGGNKSEEGTTLNNISQIFQARGDYEAALRYLQQSLQIRQEIGDKSGEGTTLNNISQIYDARGDYDTALRYLQQSLQIFQEGGNKYEEGTTLNNISQIYDARGDYDTALRYLQQSLQIFQEGGNKYEEGTTLNNISQIFKARGDYDTALRYLQQSLQIFQEIGYIAYEAVTCFNIAQILEQKGDIETAIKLVQRTVEIDKITGHPDLQSDTAYLNQLMKKIKG